MVTVKLKPTESARMFKNNQSGTVTFSLEDLHKIYIFEKAYNEFIQWTKREHIVYGQGRTPEYNKSVKGNAKSNHLKCLARDTYFKNVDFDTERVKKYMRKWRDIAKANGFVGECGFYPSYRIDGCKGMLHIGMNTYSKTFTNWMTDSVQHTNYYKL